MPSLNHVRSSSSPCHLSILYDLHQVHAISHCTIFPSCTIFIKSMTYLHQVRSSHPVRPSSNPCHLSTMYYLPICMISIRNDLPILYVCTHPHIIPPLCIIFKLCSICIQNHAICTSCTTRISTVPSLYHVQSLHPMKSFASIMPSLHPERSSHPARFSNQNPLVTLQCPIATATATATNKQTNKQTNNPQKQLMTLVRQLTKPTLMKTTRILFLLRDGLLLLLKGRVQTVCSNYCATPRFPITCTRQYLFYQESTSRSFSSCVHRHLSAKFTNTYFSLRPP